MGDSIVKGIVAEPEVIESDVAATGRRHACVRVRLDEIGRERSRGRCLGCCSFEQAFEPDDLAGCSTVTWRTMSVPFGSLEITSSFPGGKSPRAVACGKYRSPARANVPSAYRRRKTASSRIRCFRSR